MFVKVWLLTLVVYGSGGSSQVYVLPNQTECVKVANKLIKDLDNMSITVRTSCSSTYTFVNK